MQIHKQAIQRHKQDHVDGINSERQIRVDQGEDNNLESGVAAKNNRLAFDVLKTLTGSMQSRAVQIEDRDRKLLTESNYVLER